MKKTLENKVENLRQRRGGWLKRATTAALLTAGSLLYSSSGCDSSQISLFKDSGPDNTQEPVSTSYERTFHAERQGFLAPVDGFRILIDSEGVSKERQIQFSFPNSIDYGGVNISHEELENNPSGERTLPNGDVLFYETRNIVIDPPQDELNPPVGASPVLYAVDLNSFRKHLSPDHTEQVFIKIGALNVFPGESGLQVLAFTRGGPESESFAYHDNVTSEQIIESPNPFLPGIPPDFIPPFNEQPPFGNEPTIPPFNPPQGEHSLYEADLQDFICRQGRHGINLRESDKPSLDTRLYLVTVEKDGNNSEFFVNELPQLSGGLYDHVIPTLYPNQELVAVSGGGFDREPQEIVYTNTGDISPERCNNHLPFVLAPSESKTITAQGYQDGYPVVHEETIFREQ